MDWSAYHRREGAHDCTTNERPPAIVIIPYALDHPSGIHTAVEFEVVGELPSGCWVNLKAYSVPVDDVMTSLQGVAGILRAAWNAACDWKPPT